MHFTFEEEIYEGFVQALVNISMNHSFFILSISPNVFLGAFGIFLINCMHLCMCKVCSSLSKGDMGVGYLFLFKTP